MASDNFTDSDGTGLESHDANWTSIGGNYVVTNYEINSNRCETEAAWQYAGAYNAGSSADDSQIIFAGGASATPTIRHVAARCGAQYNMAPSPASTPAPLMQH